MVAIILYERPERLRVVRKILGVLHYTHNITGHERTYTTVSGWAIHNANALV